MNGTCTRAEIYNPHHCATREGVEVALRLELSEHNTGLLTEKGQRGSPDPSRRKSSAPELTNACLLAPRLFIGRLAD